MSGINKPKISYTSRDFQSIKNDLINMPKFIIQKPIKISMKLALAL